MRTDTYTITVRCDGRHYFKRRAEAVGTTLTQCLNSLKARGWQLGRKRDYCPECAEKMPRREKVQS